jgi:hypothetical protein
MQRVPCVDHDFFSRNWSYAQICSTGHLRTNLCYLSNVFVATCLKIKRLLS